MFVFKTQIKLLILCMRKYWLWQH